MLTVSLKTDYDAKISEIEKKDTDHDHDKYITTSEFNKLTTEHFKARLAQVNLVTNIDLSNRLQSCNRNIVSSRELIKINKSKLNVIQKFDLSYFKGKTYIASDDSTQ